jgi:hypothetical protein
MKFGSRFLGLRSCHNSIDELAGVKRPVRDDLAINVRNLGSVDKFLNRENRFFGIPVFGFAL